MSKNEKDKRVQINIRIDQDLKDRVDRLIPIVEDKLGLGLKLSVASIFRMGVALIEHKYLGKVQDQAPSDRPVSGTYSMPSDFTSGIDPVS